jgi:aromatic-L-amino-acid decarboxylase
MGRRALDFIVEFIEGLPEAPASDLEGAVDEARGLAESAPEEGASLDDLLTVVERGATKAFNTTGPGYLAYIPGGGLYAAALGEFLAAAINRYIGVWNAAPILAQVEWMAVRWLCDLFDYPPEARGILTSGGSLSNFSGIVSARKALLGEELRGARIYVTDQTHASVAKSAGLAGIPVEGLRTVPTDVNLRMDPDALGELIREDRRGGHRPFCVVASAGTTNTGAVDPLDAVLAVARAEGLWTHVDAAYGGPFRLTDRGRALFRGIEEADSITLDPHKAMFLPYGTGALLVRRGHLLREAHEVGADYLQDLAGEEEIPNFTDYSPELSRSFRGLGVWLPIKLHGLSAFREALDEKLDLARFMHEELTATPGFEIPWAPQLTVVAFRYRPRSGDPEEFNARLLERINASRRVFLSSTTLRGRFTIRACIVSHRTHRDRIEEAVDIVRRAAAELDGS